MTTQSHTDGSECDRERERERDRQARQIQAVCTEIDVVLMRRPGALPPGEKRDAIEMLSDMARGCPALVYANEDRQLDAGLNFVRLWRSMLTDEADLLWADDDDQDA